MESKQLKNQKGITLIALVVTIIVLIILAGIAISMTVGENGIFTKAKEAKRLQITAEAKEKIGTEILAAQVEAIERNEELEQEQVEDIISKYGTLQDDKDTIILKDNGYEISLLDIYQGTTTSTGSYTENKAKIELLEGQVKRLQEQLDSMSQTGDEKDKTIADLNEKVTTIENEKNDLQNENNNLTSKATELTNLKETLSKVTAAEGQILKDYTAYKEGKLITGTMENYSGKTITASRIVENGSNAEITIPLAGYYGTDSKVSIPVETIKKDVGTINNSLGKQEFIAYAVGKTGSHWISSSLRQYNNEYITTTDGVTAKVIKAFTGFVQLNDCGLGSSQVNFIKNGATVLTWNQSATINFNVGDTFYSNSYQNPEINYSGSCYVIFKK